MHTVSHPVTGVILAGGKSRRMGHDKAFLAIDGLPLVERVLRLFTDTFAAVIIVGGQAERFAPYRLPVYLNTPDDLAQLKNKKGRDHPMTTKAVSFVAKSGTGKTTLLEKVISELKGRGYRVGVIKHDAHRFDIDHPGKDSHRLTAAGADTMLISSPEKLAVIKKHAAPPPVEDLIATYFGDVDIVLTEGFKMGGMPKIEVHRREMSNSLLCRGEHDDPTLVAVASDSALELDVPVLDLDDPVAVADFIVARFLV
jgi:molybdopterin-guanine dinucleotide biosynthesis protein MobB